MHKNKKNNNILVEHYKIQNKQLAETNNVLLKHHDIFTKILVCLTVFFGNILTHEIEYFRTHPHALLSFLSLASSFYYILFCIWLGTWRTDQSEALTLKAFIHKTENMLSLPPRFSKREIESKVPKMPTKGIAGLVFLSVIISLACMVIFSIAA